MNNIWLKKKLDKQNMQRNTLDIRTNHQPIVLTWENEVPQEEMPILNDNYVDMEHAFRLSCLQTEMVQWQNVFAESIKKK